MEIRRYTQSRIALMTLVFMSLSVWAHAQSPDSTSAPGNPDRHHGQCYVFLAPGAYVGYAETRATMHFGGGGEGRR
jgi:hypothetical protein